MKNKRKLYAIIVAIAIIALSVASMFALTGCNNSVRQVAATHDLSETDNGLAPSQTYELPTRLSLSSVGSSITLTASVLPSNLTDKEVDWHVVWQFKNWVQTEGPATNYLTVVPLSNGSATATVTCLQAFQGNIEIWVIARANRTITYACVVEFTRKLQPMSKIRLWGYSANQTQNLNWELLSNSASVVNLPSITNPLTFDKDLVTCFAYYTDWKTPFVAKYTREEDLISTTYSIMLSSAFAQCLSNNGVTAQAQNFTELVMSRTEVENALKTIYGDPLPPEIQTIYNGMQFVGNYKGGDFSYVSFLRAILGNSIVNSNGSLNQTLYNKYISAVSQLNGAQAFTLRVTMIGEVSGAHISDFIASINPATAITAVQNISLDQTTLVV